MGREVKKPVGKSKRKSQVELKKRKIHIARCKNRPEKTHKTVRLADAVYIPLPNNS